MLKLRIQRYGHRVMLPIYLAASPTLPQALLTSVVPSLAGAVARRCLLLPLRDRRRRKQLRHERKAAEEVATALDRARRAAALDAQLLERDAAQRAQEERARNGLLIIAAFYGDVQVVVETCYC